jgi:ATP-dependent Clp protease ATP-binding subunit ClpC
MTDDTQLTPRMKRTMTRAAELARARGHDYLGTEHMILALIEDADGIAGLVMNELGYAAAIRAGVTRIMESVGYSSRSQGHADLAHRG